MCGNSVGMALQCRACMHAKSLHAYKSFKQHMHAIARECWDGWEWHRCTHVEVTLEPEWNPCTYIWPVTCRPATSNRPATESRPMTGAPSGHSVSTLCFRILMGWQGRCCHVFEQASYSWPVEISACYTSGCKQLSGGLWLSPLNNVNADATLELLEGSASAVAAAPQDTVESQEFHALTGHHLASIMSLEPMAPSPHKTSHKGCRQSKCPYQY
eukprot:366512-Chlamydomonas_euryale.AAC.25